MANEVKTLLDWRHETADHYHPLVPPMTGYELMIECAVAGRAECAATPSPIATAHSIAGAVEWQRLGKPRYVLTESMASLLVATKSPPMGPVPFSSFVVEVPRRYLPSSGPAHLPTWMSVFQYSHGGVVHRLIEVASDANQSTTEFLQVIAQGVDSGENADIVAVTDVHGDDETIRAMQTATKRPPSKEVTLITRLLSNVVAYVTEYKESATPRASRSGPSKIYDVRPPVGVVVDRAFRDRAAALVSAGTFDGARRVLRHMVRGHWKRQAVGAARAGRELRWVQPYLRGDATFGSVIERVTRLDEAN